MVASISLGIRQGGTEAVGADDAVVGVGVDDIRRNAMADTPWVRAVVGVSVDDIAVAISAISAVSVSCLELEVGLEPKQIWTFPSPPLPS